MSLQALAAPAPLRLWKVSLDTLPSAQGIATLSAAERERAQRFAFEHLQRRYLAAHVALRGLLSELAGLPAQALQFSEGPHGKPMLAPASCAFNMSHSDDVALIAIAPQGDIGVDIEVLRPVQSSVELARRNFTATEHQVLAQASPDQQDLIFLRTWTRKEACLKAVGSGFSIAPQTFEAGALPEAQRVTMTTPRGNVQLHVESLPELDECVMAIAWVID